ncbi:NAD(P)-dependent alcohol dehydrogenase [Sphingomonas oligophenolica]|uniref:NAD(P)-dependent alcohol dehydrogenase n=1 Tax=Sphingomonas oligophenolica TaxID=301154 RepID=A0ABU9YA27_9SPHN
MGLIKYEIAADQKLTKLASVPMKPRPPAGNEILVRIEASSLNFHDYLIATGVIATTPGRIPLADGVGVIEACGPQAQRFSVGDTVMGTFFPDWHRGDAYADGVAQMRGDHIDGFGASYVVMPEAGFTKAPATLDAVAAACLPCAGLTAWRSLFVEGSLRPGDSVVVQGTGGVSMFALQFARAAGARVIATTGSPEKADRLRALGAHGVVDRFDPEWGLAVRKLADGGADHLIEVSGGDLTQSLSSLRTGGRLCLVGVLSLESIAFAPQAMLHANRRISGITVGSREHQEAMIAAVERTGISPVIDTTFPLSSLREAFEYFGRRQHVGKIAISAT